MRTYAKTNKPRWCSNRWSRSCHIFHASLSSTRNFHLLYTMKSYVHVTVACQEGITLQASTINRYKNFQSQRSAQKLNQLNIQNQSCVSKKKKGRFQASLWHPAPALQEPEAPWREAPQGKCPQRGPRVNNLYESLLAWCSLRAGDALLPLLL